MNETTVPAIGIERLSHGYKGKVVLHDLNLTVAAGEIFGFLGHNGAGRLNTCDHFASVVTIHVVNSRELSSIMLGKDSSALIH